MLCAPTWMVAAIVLLWMTFDCWLIWRLSRRIDKALSMLKDFRAVMT